MTVSPCRHLGGQSKVKIICAACFGHRRSSLCIPLEHEIVEVHCLLAGRRDVDDGAPELAIRASNARLRQKSART